MLRWWNHRIVASYGSSGETGARLASEQAAVYVIPLYEKTLNLWLPRYAEPLYLDLKEQAETQRKFNPRWKTVAREFVFNMRLSGTDAYRLLQGYSRETRRALESVIRQGLREELSPRQVADLLEKRLSSLVPVRARRIAITEASRAQNIGQFVAAQEAALVTERAITKTWQWSGISREDHAAINGTTLGMDEYFAPGGEQGLYPHDPALSAGQSANCSCFCQYGLVSATLQSRHRIALADLYERAIGSTCRWVT